MAQSHKSKKKTKKRLAKGTVSQKWGFLQGMLGRAVTLIAYPGKMATAGSRLD